MSTDKKQAPHDHTEGCGCGQPHAPKQPADLPAQESGAEVSRRGFLGGTAGIAAASALGAGLIAGTEDADAHSWHDRGDWDDKRWRRRGDPPRGGGHKDRILLKGGVVLSLDPAVGDFAKADVLIEGKKIKAVGPNLKAGGAQIVDCSGMIVMPGFITTHHHQYETLHAQHHRRGLCCRAAGRRKATGRSCRTSGPRGGSDRQPPRPGISAARRSIPRTCTSASWWPA